MVHAAAKSFGGWTQPRQILGVKRSQRGFNGLANPNDAFFDSRTEERDPKLTSIE